MNNVFKFVSHDIPSLETLSNCSAFKLMEKLNKGEDLTREEKNSIPAKGYTQIAGYQFNFRPFLKTFWINTKYYNIIERYAIDKTAARYQLNAKEYTPNSQIIKIMQVN